MYIITYGIPFSGSDTPNTVNNRVGLRDCEKRWYRMEKSGVEEGKEGYSPRMKISSI